MERSWLGAQKEKQTGAKRKAKGHVLSLLPSAHQKPPPLHAAPLINSLSNSFPLPILVTPPLPIHLVETAQILAENLLIVRKGNPKE